jgi:hypothetical protein
MYNAVLENHYFGQQDDNFIQNFQAYESSQQVPNDSQQGNGNPAHQNGRIQVSSDAGSGKVGNQEDKLN